MARFALGGRPPQGRRRPGCEWREDRKKCCHLLGSDEQPGERRHQELSGLAVPPAWRSTFCQRRGVWPTVITARLCPAKPIAPKRVELSAARLRRQLPAARHSTAPFPVARVLECIRLTRSPVEAPA